MAVESATHGSHDLVELALVVHDARTRRVALEPKPWEYQPEARIELTEAVRWYEERRAGVGAALEPSGQNESGPGSTDDLSFTHERAHEEAP